MHRRPAHPGPQAPGSAAVVAAAPPPPSGSAPSSSSPRSSLISAAFEGLLAFLVLIVGSGFLVACFREGVRGFPREADIVYMIQIAGVLLLLCLGYGRRFFPWERLPAAALRTLRQLAALCSPLRLGALPAALVAFHAVQVCLLGASTALGEGADLPALAERLQTRGLACANFTSLLWAPLFEELVFRVGVFYVVAQRSGGDLPFASLVGASLFAALHLGNVYQSPDAASALTLLLGFAGGLVLATLFARSSSLLAVVLVHAANNAAATAWLGLAAEEGDDVRSACGAPARTASPAFLASLFVQLAVYGAAGAAGYAALVKDAATTAAAAAAASAPVAAIAGDAALADVARVLALQERHRLLYVEAVSEVVEESDGSGAVGGAEGGRKR